MSPSPGNAKRAGRATAKQEKFTDFNGFCRQAPINYDLLRLMGVKNKNATLLCV
jgi:hypothetical protein